MQWQCKSAISHVQRASARTLIVALFATCWATGRAQQIRIKAVNGSSGKPVVNECLNIWAGTLPGTHLVARTDKSGVAVLNFTETGFSTGTGCPGWPTVALRQADSPGIIVAGDRYIACQENGKITSGGPPVNSLNRMPSYAVTTLLKAGISAGNTCGKFRAKAAPGELILFMRAPHWWERTKQ
jgi:hypothetical protein